MRSLKVLLAVVLMMSLVFGSSLAVYAQEPILTVTIYKTGYGLVTQNVVPVEGGYEATLTAEAYPGYRFIRWQDELSEPPWNQLSRDLIYVFPITTNMTVRGQFEPVFNLTINADETMGLYSIYGYDSEIHNGFPQDGEYIGDEELIIIPEAMPGYYFVGSNFMGMDYDDGDPIEFFMPENDLEITLNFAPLTTEPTSEPTTEAPTEPTTAPTTEAPTEPTTAPTTEAPTEPTTAPTTDIPTTEPTTAPTTDIPTTDPTTAPTTEAPTEPTTAATTAATTEDDDEVITITFIPTTSPATTETIDATEVVTEEGVPLGAPGLINFDDFYLEDVVNFDEFLEEETLEGTDGMVEEDEVILDGEVPLADGLPQTGQLSAEMLYGIGGLISGLGLWLKRKK